MRSVRIQKDGTNTGDRTHKGKQYSFENSISKDFKLFTTINKTIIVEFSSRQADKQASGHPSEAKQYRRQDKRTE